MDNTIFLDSLRNLIRAMNRLYEMAVSDLTLDHMNHHERPGVLPMAFSFSHFIKIQDTAMSMQFAGIPPIWGPGKWAEKVEVTVDAVGREETVAEMEQIRFGNLEAWKEYQAQVIKRSAEALADVTQEKLEEVLIPALPEQMKNIFCAIVIGGVGQPVRKLEVAECFVYQHGLRHMGEIEHGRALVGLEGMTS